MGRNGCGKTSLFVCLTGGITPDTGDISMSDGLRIATMSQETPGSERTALDYVIDGDQGYRDLEAALTQAEASEDAEQAALLHAELDRIDGYTVNNRAARLLSGLGFTQQELHKPVAEFSGGWRVRQLRSMSGFGAQALDPDPDEVAGPGPLQPLEQHR